MNILITIGITIATLLTTIFGVYNYMPLSWIETVERNLGVSITTIQSTDTISNSRTTINDNFSNLNAGKIENSTTTLPLITTLAGLTSASSLATVGTITSGTWSGTAIGVSKGGTGTTSPSLYQVILGDGSRGLTVASSTGTSGQFMTSNGAGAYPSWQTSAVSFSDNYYWTGTHSFTGSTYLKTLSASSTTILNGVSLSWPSFLGASSSAAMIDGSGNITWNKIVKNKRLYSNKIGRAH